MPRSPRATITPSATAITDSRASTASWVSILATSIGPSGPTAVRTRSTSAAERTKEMATASMSARQTISSRRRSSAVGDSIRKRVLDSDTPGRPSSRPPDWTRATARSPCASSTSRVTTPSPSLTRSPSCRWATSSGWSTAIRRQSLVAPSLRGTSSTVSPGVR